MSVREKQQSHPLQRSSELLLCRHLLDPHLWPRGSLHHRGPGLAIPLSSVRPRPRLQPVPEPAASPRCPAVSPGFKLNSFILPHTFMSHQVPSTADLASPKPHTATPPPFLAPTYFSKRLPVQPHVLCCQIQRLLPQPVPASSVQAALSGSIFPKNLTSNFSAQHSKTSPYDSPLLRPSCSLLPYNYSMLQANNHLTLLPPVATTWLCPPHCQRPVYTALYPATSRDGIPRNAGFRIKSKLQCLPAAHPWTSASASLLGLSCANDDT